MKIVRQDQYSRPGFSLLEVFVTIAIMLILVPGTYSLMASATRAVSTSTREVEASFLASEGLEVVRLLRGQGWTSNIATLTNGTTYYPTLAGNNWALLTSNPGIINGAFTRTVTFAAVSRDANGDIVSFGGTNDPKSRRVTVLVVWSERGVSHSVTLQAYVTNFFDT